MSRAGVSPHDDRSLSPKAIPRDASPAVHSISSASSATQKRAAGSRGVVQFSDNGSAVASGNSAASRPRKQLGHDTESSADENTALASKKRGLQKGYGTGGSAAQAERSRNGRDVDEDSDGDPPSTRHNQRHRSAKEKNEPGWWGRTFKLYQSIELDNKGSVARDHLALERTFLAWLRTSLAFASIGIAITQLFRLNSSIAARDGHGDLGGGDGGPSNVHLRQVGKPLGATFLGISIVVLFVGFHRYFESQFWIIQGKFPASRGSIALITAIAAALIVSSLVVILIISPRTYERK